MNRRAAPESRPVVLTVAGSDSGGGAGIQADLKTMEACGAFGTSAITSVTAQNTRGVEGTHLLPTEEIAAQIAAVLDDFAVGAAKTGMLATADVIETVAGYADRLPNLVVDPVMVAASGDRLLEPDAESAYEDLIAEATLVTPNADEAAVLTGIEPETETDMRAVGEALLDLGATAALVKGGHVDRADGDGVADVLVTEETVETVRHPRVATDATHGSGCTLSSAIAANLARGEDLTTAVEAGIDLLARAVRYPLDVGEGPGSVHHAVALRDRAARDPTAEEVATIVEELVDRDVSPLVPESGLTVAGATPYAERPDEVAAVEGNMTETGSDDWSNQDIRFGASSRVAAVLLACREFDADRQFAVSWRFDEDVEAALAALDGEIVTVDRGGDPDAAVGDGTIQQWTAERAIERADGSPVAVVDHGDDRTEPTVVLLADDTEALVDRTLTVLDALGEEVARS
ncbi:bifunctional hydroxymethylpyrimidine kinase/phosphomethylpyrimidine kinase [Halorientalis sp. IM1011]|uniref:bifunctional hydroxymethylpyrimidine kinase/phosphomethylpyrimidine kinase n=1 Tax=Halorientalis sp. IM1011 TaxID=1932360 RepID=UPI00097CC685|nr:bifunctional hydroxymethylpyrimidine kinase/phosphomethylpyrimidine kinase [Halorientalis sp. IM1011]AQL42306.1 bifunctional hydroxymethylpyrimidine kinase/phosphomethylpyrimidine kinase [Halorientalis sp. IM1011]